MNDPNDHPNVTTTQLFWTTSDGTRWRIELEPDLIILTGPDETCELASSTWARDVYVTPHRDGYIIRFETSTRSLGFIVPAQDAAPLLDHIRSVAPQAVTTAATLAGPPPKPRDPLLWPKVSPLAVWALITSSLVFVPVVGIIPALVTAVLLVLHRMRVRRVAAYRHSRAMCAVAFGFTITGLAVSALGTWGLMQDFYGHDERAPLRFDRAPDDHATATPRASAEQDQTEQAIVLSTTRRASHRSAILAGILDQQHNWPLIVMGLLAVIFSLSVHECAHAITAWWLGDDLARRLGRVTLSPIAHIDPFGTVILPLILFLSEAGVFGWAKPVPVQLDHLVRHRRAHILVSIAGPGSNLLLASLSMMLLIAIGCGVRILAPEGHIENFAHIDFSTTVSASGFTLAPILGPLCTFLQMSFLVNVFLAFFNLIPIPPLDGSWVLEHMFPRTLGPIYERLRPFAFMLFLGLIYTGVLVYLLTPAFVAIRFSFGVLAECTGF